MTSLNLHITNLNKRQLAENYLPCFGTLRTSPHPNADKMKMGSLYWKADGNEFSTSFSFAVGLDHYDGEEIVYFPTDSTIAECILDHELFKDYKTYLSSGKRVKSIKLRGVISEGLCVPVKLLNAIFMDLTGKELDWGLMLNAGTGAHVRLKNGEFVTLGYRYCNPKVFNKGKGPGIPNSKKNKRKVSFYTDLLEEGFYVSENKSRFLALFGFFLGTYWNEVLKRRLVECWETRSLNGLFNSFSPIFTKYGDFPKHVDTGFLDRSVDRVRGLLQDSSYTCRITKKLHGTSQRYGLVEKLEYSITFSGIVTLLRDLYFNNVKRISDTHYDISRYFTINDCGHVWLLGTRNVNLGEVGQNQVKSDGYYTDAGNWREYVLSSETLMNIENKAREIANSNGGYLMSCLIYGEVTGKTSTNGSTIMPKGNWKNISTVKKPNGVENEFFYSYPYDIILQKDDQDNHFFVYNVVLVWQDKNTSKIIMYNHPLMFRKFPLDQVPAVDLHCNKTTKAAILSGDFADLKNQINRSSDIISCGKTTMSFPEEGIVVSFYKDSPVPLVGNMKSIHFKLKGLAFREYEGRIIDDGGDVDPEESMAEGSESEVVNNE